MRVSAFNLFGFAQQQKSTALSDPQFRAKFKDRDMLVISYYVSITTNKKLEFKSFNGLSIRWNGGRTVWIWNSDIYSSTSYWFDVCALSNIAPSMWTTKKKGTQNYNDENSSALDKMLLAWLGANESHGKAFFAIVFLFFCPHARDTRSLRENWFSFYIVRHRISSVLLCLNFVHFLHINVVGITIMDVWSKDVCRDTLANN